MSFMGNDAMSSVNEAQTNEKWLDAMEKEIGSFHENNIWELVELPADQKAVGSKWVFKVKTNADDSIESCKACLVAQGYSQTDGLDYDETFSPVVRSVSVRSVVALAAMNNLRLHQILHGDLQEEAT